MHMELIDKEIDMSLQKYIVTRDDSIYEAFPDVTLTKDGKLVCVFTECNAHGDRNNSRIMIITSTDHGRTWSEKKPFTERTTFDDFFNCSRISTLPDGRLAIICDRIYGREKPGRKNEIYIWFSDDNGDTWSKPVLFPYNGFVPDKYRVLKSGRHIVSAQNYGQTGKLEQYLWYSDDGGNTWSDRVTVASDERYNLCEGCLLETPEGALLCYLRENSGRGYDCFKTVSYDNGQSWSEVANVPLPGCHRPVAGYLSNGNILITHRFMQGGKGWLGSWTQNVFASFLPGEQATAMERSQQSARIFPLDFDRSPVSDIGYTGWVQFEDGEIYVVNYIVDDAPKAHIRGYAFRLEDVLL